LSWGGFNGNGFRMSEDPYTNMSREERLAAKLRENLRRRKAQNREISRESADSQGKPLPKGDTRS